MTRRAIATRNGDPAHTHPAPEQRRAGVSMREWQEQRRHARKRSLLRRLVDLLQR